MEELIYQMGEKELYIAQDFLPYIEALAQNVIGAVAFGTLEIIIFEKP